MPGVDRIAAERQRQMEVEGWTPEHDALHVNGELAMAACCYAAPQKIRALVYVPQNCGCRSVGECSHIFPVKKWVDPWPWDPNWDKREKHSPLRCLEIAGALIAAEIDRLERLENELPEVKRG